MAVRLWRFLMANAVWGEDMMVPEQRYACHAQAVALTYLEAFALSRDRLQAAGTYIYIYIYIERERERERDIQYRISHV